MIDRIDHFCDAKKNQQESHYETLFITNKQLKGSIYPQEQLADSLSTPSL